MRSHRNLVPIRWLLLAVLPWAVCGCAVRRGAKLDRYENHRTVDLKVAQREVDFVIYAPTYLPSGARVDKALVIPEQMVGKHLMPNQVALDLGAGVALWEMPAGAVPVTGPRSVAVAGVGGLGGQAYLSSTPGLTRRTLDWELGGTRLGLSGDVETSLLLRIAYSCEPAHPEVTPRPVSERRKQISPGLPEPVPGLPGGGIGVWLGRAPRARVLAVHPKMPADVAGIRPGDELVAVDGRPTAGLSRGQLGGLVRGEPGSEVRITVRRRRDGRTQTLTLRRAPQPVLHRQPVGREKAQQAVSYPVLSPGWLPRGFKRAEVTLHAWDPNPAGLEPEVQLICDGPNRAVITIAQRGAATTWPPWPSPPGAVAVKVGSEPGMLAQTPGGSSALQWRRGKTVVRLWGLGVPVADVMRVARSMRPAKGGS